MRSTHLVLSILRNAPTVDKRTTMCARPVQVSVTVIVGHEKVRNSSNDSKNTPHDLSNLHTCMPPEAWHTLSRVDHELTRVCYVVGNDPYTPSRPTANT